MKKELNPVDSRFLGEGHNGKVYLLPDGKVIKIFFRSKVCKNEYYILNRVSCNKYYPKVFDYGDNYIIRECVHGICLKDYILQK